MTPEQMRAAVSEIAGRARTEGSGRMDLARAAQAAACGVDAISVGALTHSAPTLDIGLRHGALAAGLLAQVGPQLAGVAQVDVPHRRSIGQLRVHHHADTALPAHRAR